MHYWNKNKNNNRFFNINGPFILFITLAISSFCRLNVLQCNLKHCIKIKHHEKISKAIVLVRGTVLHIILFPEYYCYVAQEKQK